MSINKLNLLLLQLLLIISLGIGCWARPRWQQQRQQQQQLDAALNEVTSREAEQIPNDFIEEISRGYYKKRRSFYNNWPLPLHHSQFRGRSYYKVPAGAGYPEVGLIPPGGANYYSNEALPLSTYDIFEPETIYY